MKIVTSQYVFLFALLNFVFYKYLSLAVFEELIPLVLDVIILQSLLKSNRRVRLLKY